MTKTKEWEMSVDREEERVSWRLFYFKARHDVDKYNAKDKK